MQRELNIFIGFMEELAEAFEREEEQMREERAERNWTQEDEYFSKF